MAPFLQVARDMIRRTALGLGLLLCAAAFGCESYAIDASADGTGGSAGAASEGEVAIVDTCSSFYEDFEPSEGVSFKQDLVPILQKNCNANICHGGELETAQATLWLGPPDDEEASDDDLWFIYRSLIDVQSTVAPQLALVRRGNAAASYFMRKLDDCHDPQGLDCTLEPPLSSKPCGDAMPVLSAGLSEAERNLFRSWITSGAPEN